MLNHLLSVGHKMFCLQARRIAFSTKNGHLQISRVSLIRDNVLTAITGVNCPFYENNKPTPNRMKLSPMNQKLFTRGRSIRIL